MLDDRDLITDIEAGRHEHYSDAELYDHEYRRRRSDVNFYRRVARRLLDDPGRILDVACGTGRVTTALLRDGHQLFGLDRSRSMLVRAGARISRLGRAARTRSGLFQADMRQFALAQRFPLIVMAFNSFEHLYDDADPPGINIIMDVEDYFIISDVLVVESSWVDYHCMDAELTESTLLGDEAEASIYGQFITIPTSPGIMTLPNQNHLKGARIIGLLYPIQDSREGLFSKQVGKYSLRIALDQKNTKERV